MSLIHFFLVRKVMRQAFN